MSPSAAGRAERLPHPGRTIAGGFATAIAAGTALLSSPLATAGSGRASFEDALFTATSAVCVTGLATVDTGTYWSGFGQGVILALVQLGGLGIMTVASLVAILFSRRLGFRTGWSRRPRPRRSPPRTSAA
jgi:trk system potassium uptake protein